MRSPMTEPTTHQLRPRRLWRWGLFALYLMCTGGAAAQSASYTVVSGDTLTTIAERSGATVAELMTLNGLSDTTIYAGQVLALPTRVAARVGLLEHAVTAGESVAAIASTYGLSEASLLAANPALRSSLRDAPLIPGLVLTVPPGEGQVVTLRRSDNLLSVALQHGLSAAELARVNGLGDASAATAGARLFIPGEVRPAEPPSPAAAPARVAATDEVETDEVEADEGGTSETSAEPPEEARAQHLAQQRQVLGKAATLLASYDPGAQGFSWPLTGALTSGFGRRNISVGGNTFHGGIDLRAARGAPVGASRSGTVSRAGWGGAYGYVVYVDHPDGSQTRYAHLDDILVSVGERVRQGERVGLVGSTGASTGPHLHFEIRFGGSAVNPLDYLP